MRRHNESKHAKNSNLSRPAMNRQDKSSEDIIEFTAIIQRVSNNADGVVKASSVIAEEI